MVPPILQLPLGDTIGIIADTDFYKDWLNLVPVYHIVGCFDVRISFRDLILPIWLRRMLCYKLRILYSRDGVQNSAPTNCSLKSNMC
jgi:hypothetical protein